MLVRTRTDSSAKMRRSTIVHAAQPSTREGGHREGVLRPAGGCVRCVTIAGERPKYDPLRDHLAGLPPGQNRATMSFIRVEELLGEPLPPSARAYDDWWRGRARWRKVIESRPWETVGWVVDDLNLRLGIVTFRRQT